MKDLDDCDGEIIANDDSDTSENGECVDNYLINDTNFLGNEQQIMQIKKTYVVTVGNVCMPGDVGQISIPRYDNFRSIQSGMKTVINDVDNDKLDDEHDVVLQQRSMRVERIDDYIELIETAITTINEISIGLQKRHSEIRNKMINTLCYHNEDSSKVSVSKSPDAPNIDIQLFSSLTEISDAFSFTTDQHRSFYIVGCGLLKAYGRDEQDSTDVNFDDIDINSISLLLHGIGGSGKSYVIRALVALSKSWLREGSIITCAIAGVAAANVNGYTIASLLLAQSTV